MTAAGGREDLRAALIGYGLAGAVFHAPLITAVPGLELAAIVTRDERRRVQAAQRHPQAEPLEDAEGVWKRADQFDLAVIAAPNRAHVPLATAALETGLPVVVDKPVATRASAARQLADTAREKGLALIPFHNRRWDGDFLTLRRLIEQGELGEVLRFESRFERWSPQVPDAWRELPDPEEGGGVLFDLGIHLVDQSLQLFGPLAAVYAELDSRRQGARVADDAFVALTHSSGTRSHLWMSEFAAHTGPRFRVLGNQAAYVKWGLDVQEDALREGRLPGESGWGSEERSRWGQIGIDEETTPVQTEPGAYQRFYEGVVATIRDGAPPPVDPADAITALRVLDAASVSAGEKRLVELR